MLEASGAAVRADTPGAGSGDEERPDYLAAVLTGAALADMDPAKVAALAVRHRVEGLVHRGLGRLQRPGPAPVPGVDPARSASATLSGRAFEAIRSALHAVATPAAAENLGRIAELHRLSDLMASAEIPMVSFKGPTLAVQAYGDVALRPYGDVDVLLPPEHWGNLVSALRSAGYTDRRAGFGLSASPEHWHEWGFLSPDGVTTVEVHWSLVRPSRFPHVDSSESWTDLESVEVLGRPIPTLRREVLLPLLCIHATSHAWGWLEFPASIAGLLARADRLDWEEVLGRVERWRAQRIFAVGLLLTRDLFGTEAPEPIRDRLLRDRTALRLSRSIERRLLHDHRPPRTASPGLWWMQMRLRDSAGDGLRAGRQLLIGASPTEWEEGGPHRPSVKAALRRIRRLLRKSWEGR